MSGADLNTVGELLGHKSLEMTLRYSHLSQDHKKRAVDVLAKQTAPLQPSQLKEANTEKFDNLVTLLDTHSYNQSAHSSTLMRPQLMERKRYKLLVEFEHIKFWSSEILVNAMNKYNTDYCK